MSLFSVFNEASSSVTSLEMSLFSDFNEASSSVRSREMSLSVEHKSKSYLPFILTSLETLFCYTDIDSTNSLITKY